MTGHKQYMARVQKSRDRRARMKNKRKRGVETARRWAGIRKGELK